VFEDVAGPGAVAQALQETAALADATAVLDQSRQPGGQAFIQAGEGVRGIFFEFANVEPGFDDGAVRPDMGPRRWVTRRMSMSFFFVMKNFLPCGDRSLTAGVALSLCVVLTQFP
jgi:hypothetical protein